jgi:outer membrane protein TolC
MQAASVKRTTVALWLVFASMPSAAIAADPELSLENVVRQALQANLDLASQRRALAADHEEVLITRSDLLPQIDLGAQAQRVEDDRKDSPLGDTHQESVSLTAELTQVVYDEEDWADFGIQEHVYVGQEANFESFRLGVVQSAANTFLELDRARAILDNQERNRELTARNLETSRTRIAAGWSSEREVLRWQSQLATNDTDVVGARTRLLVNRFELNRVRNQRAEAPIAALPATIEEYGFVYASMPIAEAIQEPETDRRLRDLLVLVGLARSPELAALDAAVAAEERLLTSNERAFWVPSVSVGAGVDYVEARGSGPDTTDTQWRVGAGLTFPLLNGGGKFAELRQSQESLSSLRIQRRATAQSLDQGIRAAFAGASGAYTAIGFAREQETAAEKNFELVYESYVLGVASILALLDGQALLLRANQAVANALYDFLEAVIAAEDQLALYPFLEPESEMAALLDRIERELQPQP